MIKIQLYIFVNGWNIRESPIIISSAFIVYFTLNHFSHILYPLRISIRGELFSTIGKAIKTAIPILMQISK